MKNIGLSLAFASFLMIASCGKKEETTTETIVEKETVIITDTVHVAPPPPPTTEKAGTTVKVSGSGVSLDSKDVDIEIKK